MLPMYQTCIDACLKCANACEFCATSCLNEQDVQSMTKCIQLDRDCADICYLAAKYMARGSQFAKQLCVLCAQICKICGDECSKFPAQHCKDCADACYKCATECESMSQ